MKFLAPLAMLALCGFLIVFGSQQLAERDASLADMVASEAQVTRIETRRPSPTNRSSSEWVHVSFIDGSGNRIEAAYQYGLPILMPAEGDSVSIFYDPANPLRVQGAAFITMWGVYIVGALIIVLFGWMGLGLLAQNVRGLFGSAR